jgi:hypothetical protein
MLAMSPFYIAEGRAIITFSVADCSLDELPFKIIEIRAERGLERFRQFIAARPIPSLTSLQLEYLRQIVSLFVFSHKVSKFRPLASLFDPLP